MKKTLTALGAALTLSAIAGGNLFPAGDFSGELQGWKGFNRDKEYFQVDNGVLKFTGKEGDKKRVAIFYQLEAPEAGSKYVLSADVKAKVAAEAGKSVDIMIRYVNAKNGTITYRGVVVDLENPYLREYSGVCETPAGTAKIQVFVQTRNLTGGDSLEFDNIKITPFEALKADSGNLIKNGDFEYALLEPWYTSRGKIKARYFYTLKDGDNRVVALTGDKNTPYRSTSLIQKTEKLDVNKKYKFSARVRVVEMQNGEGKRILLRVRSANAKNKSLTYSERTIKNPTVGDWQTVTFTFKPHKDTAFNQVYLNAENFEKGDVVLVDDVVIVPAE